MNDRPIRERSNVVLLVNPSHQHPFEQAFWADFGAEVEARGWSAIDLNFRKVPAFPGVDIFVQPARLRDLARRLAPFHVGPLPAWAGEDLIALQVDWEMRRWQLDERDPELRRGCEALCHYIDHVIRRLNPLAVYTTNKIDHPNRFAYLAARHYDIEYRFVERSPLDTYIIERAGMFAESGRYEFVRNAAEPADPVGTPAESDRLRQAILESPYGFREREASRSDVPARTPGAPLFVLPLDNLLWTGWSQLAHPQGDVDYPVFRDPEAALSAVHQAVAALGGELLIKPHPSCKEWPGISRRLPELQFTDADLDVLCDAGDVIVTFLTKVSYLGLAKGKPVVSFGTGLLDGLEITYEVSAPTELPGVLGAALRRDGLEEKVARFIELLPTLASSFVTSGGDAARTLASELATADIHPATKVASDEVRRVVVSSADAAGGVLASPADAAGVVRGGPHQGATPLIFDVTRLLNARIERSGISRYAMSVAKGLMANSIPGVEVSFAAALGPHIPAEQYDKVREALGRDIAPLRDALSAAASAAHPSIFHTPMGPLPPRDPRSSVRRVITIHDVLHLTMPVYDPVPLITPKIVESIDLQNDATIFDSRHSMEQFEQVVGGSPAIKTVIHLAADRAFAHPEPRDLPGPIRSWLGDSAYATFICQVDPRKELPRMVRIAGAWAGAEGQDRKVVVVGQASGQAAFETEVERLPDDRRHRFLFQTAPDDRELAALYMGATVHLYLSSGEGFGLPPLEAMSAGCPAIVLSNSSLGEVFGDWKFALPADADDAAIGASLEELSSARENLGLVRDEARAFAGRYSWDRHLAELAALYDMVIQRSSNGAEPHTGDGRATSAAGTPAAAAAAGTAAAAAGPTAAAAAAGPAAAAAGPAAAAAGPAAAAAAGPAAAAAGPTAAAAGTAAAAAGTAAAGTQRGGPPGRAGGPKPRRRTRTRRIGRWLKPRAPFVHRGLRLAWWTARDLWRRRRWTVPAFGLVLGLAGLALVPALAELSGGLWTLALLGGMGFGAVYTTSRLRAISRRWRIAADALRRADAEASRRAEAADRTIANLSRTTQRLSDEKAALEARLEALQHMSLERYETLLGSIEQTTATATSAEGGVAAVGERIEQAALVTARIQGDVERIGANQDALGTKAEALGTEFDALGAKLSEVSSTGTKQTTDLGRIRERVVAGERQIGALRYPDAPRVLVFLGHHKCASRFFRFEVFFQIAEMTGSRIRRYVIKQPPFHYSRMDDLDLSNIDFEDLGGATRDVLLFANATDRSLEVVQRSTADWAGVRVIRDPRQVLVSDYFHHRGDHPVMPNWVWDRLVVDQPILRSLSLEEGLLYELDHISKEVIETQLMAKMDDPRILTFRIEDFAARPADHFGRMAEFLHVSDIAGIDLSRKFANPGSEPWQRHFTPALREVFKARYGQALIELGYEADLDW